MPLSLVTYFGLKSIYSAISIATIDLFQLLFAWNISFCPFTLNLFVSSEYQVSFSQTAYSWILCFYPFCQPLLIGKFNPFPFKIITDKERISVILLFVFYMLFSLISCFFNNFFWDQIFLQQRNLNFEFPLLHILYLFSLWFSWVLHLIF